MHMHMHGWMDVHTYDALPLLGVFSCNGKFRKMQSRQPQCFERRVEILRR